MNYYPKGHGSQSWRTSPEHRDSCRALDEILSGFSMEGIKARARVILSGFEERFPSAYKLFGLPNVYG